MGLGRARERASVHRDSARASSPKASLARTPAGIPLALAAHVSRRRGGAARGERGRVALSLLLSPSLCDATQWCHLSAGEPREHASGLVVRWQQQQQQPSRLTAGPSSTPPRPPSAPPPQAEERPAPLLPCAAASPAPSPGEAPALARASPPGDSFLERPIIRAGYAPGRLRARELPARQCVSCSSRSLALHPLHWTQLTAARRDQVTTPERRGLVAMLATLATPV